MKKSTFILFLSICVGLTKVTLSQGHFEKEEAIQDILHPTISERLAGYIGEKLKLSYQNRILAQDCVILVDAFRDRTETRCWQTEFWGKWFTSAVSAYQYHPTPKLKETLNRTVNDLIATQTEDGYIGNYTEDSRLERWDIWGRKYSMLGLLAYYDLSSDPKSLDAARKLADGLIKELTEKHALIVKMGAHRGMAASSILEPICLLYGRTGDKKYLDFAEEIVRQWETPDGPQLISKSGIDVSKRFPIPEKWYSKEQGQKAYEMMSCYEGLLELYRLTRKEIYREAVEKTWQNIKDTEINIAGSGSARECWFGGEQLQAMPIRDYQETCVTVTWIKLSQQLLRLTGEAKYADAIEQAYYNALVGAMKPDGSKWGYYTPLSGYKVIGKEQCGMGINCCIANGPRGLFSFPSTAVMTRKDGFQINFYARGIWNVQTPGKQEAIITQDTNYPVNGEIKLKIGLPKKEKMALYVRIPGWSKQTVITINGEVLKGITAGEYAVINREWGNRNEIKLELDMRGRLVRSGQLPENLAIVHGPIVLARDSRFPGPSIDSWITPLTDKDGYVNLELADQKQEDFWMLFKSECKYGPSQKAGDLKGKLILCDYASAGNTYDERSRFRVWFPQLIDPQSFDNRNYKLKK